MKPKKWILLSIIVIILFVLGITVYLFNPPNGNEIMFICYQYVPPVAENEKGTQNFILINRKGQYFVLDYEELLNKGKNFMEMKDYYSHNKYKPDGRILNPIDMYLCCKWLEKIDTSAEYEYEYLSTENLSKYKSRDCFFISECTTLSQETVYDNQNNSGTNMYYVTGLTENKSSLKVRHLNDTYAKKIVNKILKNWPIKNGESYIERETWLE